MSTGEEGTDNTDKRLDWDYLYYMICIEMNKPEEEFWYKYTLGKIFMLIDQYVQFSGKYKLVNNEEDNYEMTVNSMGDIPSFR
jgi:hypothetical protein